MVLEKERADRMSIYRVIYMCVDGVSAAISIDLVEIASAIGIVQLMQLFCTGVAQNFVHRYIYIYIYRHTHIRTSDTPEITLDVHPRFFFAADF